MRSQKQKKLRSKIDNAYSIMGNIQHSGAIVFRDFYMILTLCLIVIIVIMLPFINEPKEKDDGDIENKGKVTVELLWDDKSSIDLDLWIRFPDGELLGFNNKNTKSFNLLRDDLGAVHDDLKLNYELAYGRSLMEGRYVVNVQVYTNSGSEPPVESSLLIKFKDPYSPPIKRKFKMGLEGSEKTIVQFDVDKDGKVVSIINNQSIMISATEK